MENLFEASRLFLPFLISFGLTILILPLVRRLAERWGCVSEPSAERWHKKRVPYLGGVAIFIGFLVPALLFGAPTNAALWFLFISALIFMLGMYDDLNRINPATKLVGQIIVAVTAIFAGYTLEFTGWPAVDFFISAVWIVGMTNALNLLDNMDGLAGGVGLIACAYLIFFFIVGQDLPHAGIALALAGAVGGFLIFNFYPASIFMGDAGSLFLGASLGLLAIKAQGQASNVFSIVAVPALILMVPILDTLLVSLTRLLRGEPVSQGGRDHSSHRLVVLGLTEPRAVLLLYAMAAVSGTTAVLIEKVSYGAGLVVLPFVILVFTLFAAYLAQVEILPTEEGKRKIQQQGVVSLIIRYSFRRRLFEVLLDCLLIGFAYYLAFVIRFGLRLDDGNMRIYLNSLPLVLASTYISFFYFGVYRGMWRYAGVEDLVRLAKGVCGGALISIMALLSFYRFVDYSRVVFILYSTFLFLGVGGSRLSFRLFAALIRGPSAGGESILIYGAGDGGELVARECRKNRNLNYSPIGFIDDDTMKKGRLICGLPVFGGVEKLEEVLERHKVKGVLISSRSIQGTPNAMRVINTCQIHNVWTRAVRVDFVEVV